ncbi:MAG: phytanoyl-CoA dioxygenase family protein [Gemmatimonadetes bacterium]|nr:phytanoyl-CoA dioxygenase family protein [Gemmatimonadota bacterium]
MTTRYSKRLVMGKDELQMDGKYLSTLREANELLDDAEALRERMAEDGYLLIRGLHDPDKVREARRVALENLHANDQIDPDYPLDLGVAAPGKRGAFFGGAKRVTHTDEFLAVVNSPEIMGFFERFLGGPVLTFDYKWLRAVGPGDNTGAHYDMVYMGRGTPNLYTVWTPLDDVTYDMGPLVILAGSHQFEAVKETYGQMDVDRDHVTGHFTNEPIVMVDQYGGQWQTSEFRMGDVIVLGMYTMHGSINNASNRYRISTDTRYQLASEPVDHRWVGENPIAHYAWTQGKTVSMEEMRRKWKV